MKDTKWFIFTFVSTILIFSAIPISLYLTSSDITPYENLEMAVEAILLGCDEFLVEPISSTKLRRILTNIKTKSHERLGYLTEIRG